MKINTALIASLNPCKDRYENFLHEYSNQEFTIYGFLDLDKISYSDKIWVAKHLLTAHQARTFAILCAESVLPLFETKYPDNKAPRDLLNYLKTIDCTDVTDAQKIEIKRLRAYAGTAVDAAYVAAAYVADAAYAAAYAAYYAAYASAADAADAADAAASAADTAAYTRKKQQDLNLTFLKTAFSLGAE